MAETLKQRRARIKGELLKSKGGKCSSCGYKKSYSALCFHHIDPASKSFNISGTRLTRVARAKLEAEVDKCDVYCLNCHAELHDEEGWVHENGKRTKK
jgi:5-methylcytosine-specific restriction endonuclease McrA